VSKVKQIKNTLQEFSLPLIFGVIAGVAVANWDAELYHHLVHYKPLGDASLLGHEITLHFIINDLFMVLFFGIAAKEITESVLPGGALNPPSKAINPLLGTLGGVLGPVVFFFLFASMFMSDGVQDVWGAIVNAVTPGVTIAPTSPEVVFRGWGIPTATDIALAWLVARLVFGNSHPAVGFLLLLAVADDAIGLGIIAVFYPDPSHPPAPIWLLLVLAGMVVCFIFRKRNLQKWTPYIFVGGFLSWLGLLEAHLHPALALVPIVPFLPGPERDLGFFVDEEEEVDEHGHHKAHSPLEEFEHQLKTFVDFGLFFFAFANAGVELSSMGTITWVILFALLVGKTVGITLFAFGGSLLGFPLPEGMRLKHLVVAGVVAGLGLTVALFVTGEAYPSNVMIDGVGLQGPAKMGAVFSAGAAALALILGKVLGVHESNDPQLGDSSEASE
jgi:NhaA family Na+:H+ antiporter